MIIKIVEQDETGAWYNDNVGKSYEVKEHLITHYKVVEAHNSNLSHRIIPKVLCEVVE